MAELVLAEIHCYPIKSARGHSLAEASMDRFGLAGDRRWMLVDRAGTFVSQRSLPAMALLDAVPAGDGLELRWQGESMSAPRPAPSGACVIARVWEDTVVAPVAEDAVNAWLSARLGADLRLVHCPDTALRGVEPGYGPPGQLVAFSDGFPLLVLTQGSLDHLNTRLEHPVPMNRFRPNLVIAGAAPHAEDDWRELRIGGEVLKLVKPCSRCAVPSIDQATAERDPQINRALAGYRRRDGVIYFGMNAIAPAGARFRVGDGVEIVN